jgi:hypothetical protein
MRDNLLVGAFVVFFLICIGVIANKMNTRLPPETTPRLLDCDPDFWTGRDVKVRTDGLERVGDELHFRRATDRPACVVIRFRDKPPEKVPATLAGFCHGRIGDAVLVTDCH